MCKVPRVAIPETCWHEVPLPERYAYGIERLTGRRKIFSRFKFFIDLIDGNLLISPRKCL